MSEQMPLGFGADLYGQAFGQFDGPVHWPSLTAQGRAARSVELRDRVSELVDLVLGESRGLSADRGRRNRQRRRSKTCKWMSRSIRRVLCSGAVTGHRVTVIHLARPLLTGSSALPACSGGPPSNACCLSLLQVGFTEPPQSPGALVVSYTTVSPLPRAPADRGRRIHGAVCSLWHCPADHSGWLLATTLPCGARTFLGS